MRRCTSPGPMCAMLTPNVAMCRWRPKLSRMRPSSTSGTPLLSRRGAVLPAGYELLQLLAVEIGDRPELHSRPLTVRQVEPLPHHVRAPAAPEGRGARPEKQVDPVRPPLIHQGGDLTAAHIV